MELASELARHFDDYTKLFVGEVDNVGSNQLHQIRKALRGQALIYCGKNTQIRRVLRELEADRYDTSHHHQCPRKSPQIENAHHDTCFILIGCVDEICWAVASLFDGVVLIQA